MRNSTTEGNNLPEKSLFINKQREGQNLPSSNKHLKEVNVNKIVAYRCRSHEVFNKNATTSIQWCNSCVNYHHYKALIYHKYIPDTYLGMVMFIPSQHGDTSFQRRQFLRKFPLNSTHFPEIKIRHVFVFGKFGIFLNYIFTARKQSLGKVMFYTCVSVILFTGDVYPSMQWAGGSTPHRKTPPKQTPPRQTTPLPEMAT